MLQHVIVARFSAALLIAISAHAAAQDPVPNTLPNLPGPTMGLPPGPSVSDWQPRGRAVIGGTSVVTADHLRPSDLVAAIGSAPFRLPVRVAASNGTRVEIEIPDAAHCFGTVAGCTAASTKMGIKGTWS